MTDNVRLSPKKTKALNALFVGGTYQRAAKIAGVNEKTVRRWMSEDGFQAELKRATTDALAATERQLADLGSLAVLTLRTILINDDVSASSKVRAIEVTLANLARIAELRLKIKADEEIERRLSELEKLQNGKH